MTFNCHGPQGSREFLMKVSENIFAQVRISQGREMVIVKTYLLLAHQTIIACFVL